MSNCFSVSKTFFFLMATIFAFMAPRLAMAADSKIEQDSRAALNSLYAGSPGAKALGAKARGVLAFPKVIKAGLVVGGQGGDGVLLVNDKVVGHYNTTAVSVGLLAGAQAFSYGLVFMSG